MVAKIFISYRRDDSAGHAGRVHDRLALEFGSDLLFMDVDAIPLGVNFIKVLREEVAKCNVLLAVIGPHWLDISDEDGNRRLDNPNDFVRVEIAAALQRDIPVIPILLDGARIPKAQQLPKDIEELAQRNGLDVRHASFHVDMDKLIRGLTGPMHLISADPHSRPQRSPATAPEAKSEARPGPAADPPRTDILSIRAYDQPVTQARPARHQPEAPAPDRPDPESQRLDVANPSSASRRTATPSTAKGSKMRRLLVVIILGAIALALEASFILDHH